MGQSSTGGYTFRSIELKQTAFRIDGVFFPPSNSPNLPLYFVEAQMQKDEELYHRLFAEIFLELKQNPTITQWQAVVIFPRRSLEPEETTAFQSLLNSPQVRRFYLDELREEENSIELGLLKLVVASQKQALVQAQQLLQLVEAPSPAPQPIPLPTSVIIELIVTMMVYKFPQLSRQEITRMLEIAASHKETRVYQEGLEDGKRYL